MTPTHDPWSRSVVFPSLKDWIMNMDDEERLRVALVLDVESRNQRKAANGISPSPNERFATRLLGIALHGEQRSR